jgi:hypothetical protein
MEANRRIKEPGIQRDEEIRYRREELWILGGKGVYSKSPEKPNHSGYSYISGK